ncbi:superoxide dismutase [Patescibacteria group bacterium]|nr:superoxide dismutase [Patescibacteria group bacterium]
MSFTLPNLPYSYDALEPYIDAKTMEIHHSKHHQGYVDKTNAVLEGTDWADKPIEEVIAHLDQIPEDKRAAVRNVGGGVLNHNMFWTCLSPHSACSGQASGGGEPEGDLKNGINQGFGGFESFKEQFTQAAATLFGSGWAWLVACPERHGGELKIIQTANQDSPLTQGLTPILCLDVWEHAYYLKYQNRRPEYIEAFWHIVNWDEVVRRYNEVRISR